MIPAARSLAAPPGPPGAAGISRADPL